MRVDGASSQHGVAMLLTGHKSRAIFDRYNIINEQELLDAGDQLIAYLAQQAQVPRGYCQVDQELVDLPPRYWARARREPAILGIRNGHQPQLDNTMDLRLHPCSVAPAKGHEKYGPTHSTRCGSSCNNASMRPRVFPAENGARSSIGKTTFALLQ